jgi:hypothetical protein
LYQYAGLIRPNEAHGGHHIELKAGLVYDSREHEADPSRGIWAEVYAYGSPDILNGRGKYGTTPHAGFGMGFERMIMYLTGIANIRDVLPFPRTTGNADF